MPRGFKDGTHYMVDGRAIETVINIMSKFRKAANMSDKSKAVITKVMQHLIDSPTIKYSGFSNTVDSLKDKPVSEALDQMLVGFDDMLDELGLRLPDKDNEEDEE